MKRKTFLLILLALVLMTALSVTAFADGASTHIQGHNLKVTDHVELIYYVAFDESPTAYDATGVLIFTSEQDAYTIANADENLDSYGGTQTTARATYYKYYYAGLADYQMGDVLYARPYYVDGTEVVYGPVDSYSVLQYAMEQTGKTGCEPRETLVPVLEQLLEEGAAAQIEANYKVDQLVTGEYGYISLEGAVLPDGVSANGGFLVGQDVTLTGLGGTIAWYDEAGEQIATGKTLDVTVTAEPQFFRAVCTEHDFEAILVSPATCTESALYLDTCECGAVDGDPYTVGDPLGHTAVTDPAVAATCTETGLTAGSHCSVCNAVLVAQEVVPALGHIEVTDAAVAATCTATGLTAGTHCSVCDAVLTAQEVVPALGHIEVTDAAVAATCTTTGLTAGKHCSRCDAVLVAQEVVAALGHDLVNHAAQAATCTEIGWAAYDTCSRCDYTTYEEIAALGHNYEAVVTAPTCTEAGYTTHTCSRCSDSYVDTYTDALGHIEVTDAAVAATCTETGLTAGKHCSRCDALLVAQEVVPATGHTVVNDAAVAATCTTTGLTAGTHCSVCDAVLTAQEVVPALGHVEVTDAAVAATCTETGLTAGKHCSRCDAVLVAQEVVAALGHDLVNHAAQAATCTEIGWAAYDTCSRCDYTTYEEIAALGHNYEAVVTAPTCTAQGYTTHTCSRCSDSYVDTYTDALGHDLVNHAAQVATCTEIGWAAYDTCSRCDYTTYEEIAALGHNYEAVVTAPTCTEAGYTTHTCSRCADTYTDTPVAALGHDLVNHAAQAATCTEIGWAAYDTCSRCDYTTYEEIAALGHDYNAVVTAPTCTAQGYTTHTCSRCSDSYVDTYTDALGHIEVTDAAVAATCTETGLTAGKHCSRCDAILVAQEVVPALGHVEVTDAAVAATCTETGLTAGTHCSVCNAVLVAQEVVPALGHDLVNHAAQAATCTEIGWAAYDTCSRCDYTTYAEIAALGHDYKAVVTAPTCTEAGYTTHTCSRCADSYTDTPVAALGHDLVNHAAQAATCTEIGWAAYDTCSRCDYTTYEEIAALGHNYKAVVTAPTCTAQGYTTHTCSRCSDSYVDTYTDALGHIEVTDAAVAATCTTTGLTAGKHCSRCDAILVAQEVVPALGHDYNAVVTAPTCTAQGYTTHTCSRCSDSYVDTYTDALGHSWNSGVVTTAPTCTVKGVKTYTCTVCSATRTEDVAATGHTSVADAAVAATCTETGLTAGSHCSVCGTVLTAQTTTAALGHSWNSGVVTTAPTCTAKGVKTYTCTRCSDSYVDTYTDALGHSWNAGVVTTAPTCTAKGVKTYTCTRCSATYTEDVAATGHTSVTDPAVAATCTETGLTAGSHCSVCGTVLTAQQTVAALGHSWNSGVVTTAPTCTAKGVKTYTCTRCSATYTEDVAATGHTSVTDPAVAATCTATGKTEGSHCSVCGTVLTAQQTVAALGHSWNAGVVTTAPTCTAKGVKTYTCTRCSATYTEDVAATGHTSVADPAVAATCTATGKTEGAHCSVCGTVLTAQQTVAALGHNSVTDPAVAATCTATGKTEGSHCSRCGTVLTAQQTIAALGHSWNSGSVTTQPTCTAKGVKTYTCTRCSGTRTEDVAALGHNINHETGVCTRCSYTQVVYTSNGDGTCKVTGVNATSDTLITINSTSPAGDTVTSIAANAFNGSAVKELVIPASVTSIAANAFNGATYTLTKVYYGSNEIAWSRVSIGSGNGKLTGATIYYYDANEPLGGNAWHFVSSTPTVWTISDEWGELIPLN